MATVAAPFEEINRALARPCGFTDEELAEGAGENAKDACKKHRCVKQLFNVKTQFSRQRAGLR